MPVGVAGPPFAAASDFPCALSPIPASHAATVMTGEPTASSVERQQRASVLTVAALPAVPGGLRTKRRLRWEKEDAMSPALPPALLTAQPATGRLCFLLLPAPIKQKQNRAPAPRLSPKQL